MRRFDRDEQLNPIGFEDVAALMGLAAEQKYSKSYSAIAKAIRLSCPSEHVQGSLAQLFAMVTFINRTQHPRMLAIEAKGRELFLAAKSCEQARGVIISRAIHSEAFAQNFLAPRHSVGASKKAPL